MIDHDSTQLAEELRARRRDLDMVVRALHRLIRYTEPRPLFEAMARVGADALGTDRCAVLIKAETGDELVYAGTLGVSSEHVDTMTARGISLDSDLPAPIAFREQRPVAVPDVGATDMPPDLKELSTHQEIGSLLCCPVVAEGEALGVLITYYREPRPFHPDEVRRLSLLAEICAIAVQNARAFENARTMAEELARRADDLERRNAELRIIADLAPTLAIAGSARQMLQAFFSHTVHLVAFEQLALLRLDPANPKEIVIREVHSTSPASFNRGWRTAWDGTLLESPLIGRRSTWHALTPSARADGVARMAVGLGLRSLALFPLVAGREVLGVLLIGSVRPEGLGAEGVATLEPIAAQLAGAIARLDDSRVP